MTESLIPNAASSVEDTASSVSSQADEKLSSVSQGSVSVLTEAGHSVESVATAVSSSFDSSSSYASSAVSEAANTATSSVSSASSAASEAIPSLSVPTEAFDDVLTEAMDVHAELPGMAESPTRRVFAGAMAQVVPEQRPIMDEPITDHEDETEWAKTYDDFVSG